MKRIWFFILVIGATALLIASPAAEASGKKVRICHVPPGNPANAHVIKVDKNAWEAGHSPHNSHNSDFLVTAGKCPPDPTPTEPPSTEKPPPSETPRPIPSPTPPPAASDTPVPSPTPTVMETKESPTPVPSNTSTPTLISSATPIDTATPMDTATPTVSNTPPPHTTATHTPTPTNTHIATTTATNPPPTKEPTKKPPKEKSEEEAIQCFPKEHIEWKQDMTISYILAEIVNGSFTHGEQKDVKIPLLGESLDPVMSTSVDGCYWYFSAVLEGESDSDLFAISVFGGPVRQLTFTPNVNESHSYATEHYIYFTSEEDSDYAVERISIDGKGREVIASSCQAPSVSPDGLTILCEGVEKTFAVPNTGESERLEASSALGITEGEVATQYVWRPNQSGVVYQMGGHFISNQFGEAEQPKLFNEDAVAIAFRPGGTFVATVEFNQLVVSKLDNEGLPTAGEPVSGLALDTLQDAKPVWWSPDRLTPNPLPLNQTLDALQTEPGEPEAEPSKEDPPEDSSSALSPNGFKMAFVRDGQLWVKWVNGSLLEGHPDEWSTGVETHSVVSWGADWRITVKNDRGLVETDQFGGNIVPVTTTASTD